MYYRRKYLVGISLSCVSLKKDTTRKSIFGFCQRIKIKRVFTSPIPKRIEYPENLNIHPILIYLYQTFLNNNRNRKVLRQKSVNKAQISRSTEISACKLSELCLKSSTRLIAKNFTLSQAIDTKPSIV